MYTRHLLPLLKSDLRSVVRGGVFALPASPSKTIRPWHNFYIKLIQLIRLYFVDKGLADRNGRMEVKIEKVQDHLSGLPGANESPFGGRDLKMRQRNGNGLGFFLHPNFHYRWWNPRWKSSSLKSSLIVISNNWLFFAQLTTLFNGLGCL